MRSGGRSSAGRYGAAGAVLASFVLPLPIGLGAGAQQVQPGQSIRDLPRPGYEIGRWRVGNTTLLPSLSASTTYDSNVYATSVAAISDAVFDIRPRIEIDSQGSALQIKADAYAHARLLAEQTREDTVAFGAGGSANYTLDRRTSLTGGLRFGRDWLHRADPEASPILLPPALFNTVSGDGGFRWQGNNILIGLNGSVQKVDFLDPGEDDRDLTSWRGSMRLGYAASPRIGIFVEPYYNRRDARLPFDKNGINRDVTTFGALAGVSFDITQRFTGELGVGAFKAIPADPFPSYTGLAFSGNLTWSPTPRTVIAFTGFRGDVATIKSGAYARTDTRLQVRIDQEVRHNLLFNAAVAMRKSLYLGLADRQLTSVGGNAELEYLVNRTLSVFVNAGHENRTGTDPLDRFKRTTVGIGARLRV